MKTRKILKKGMSLILAFSMLFALFVPMSAQAALKAGATEKGQLNLVALEPDKDSTGIGKYGYSVVNQDLHTYIRTKNVGDKIFIGVQAKNFANIAEADKGLGIQYLSFKLEYDAESVVPGFRQGYAGRIFSTTSSHAADSIMDELQTEAGGYYDYKEELVGTDVIERTYSLADSNVDTTAHTVTFDMKWDPTATSLVSATYLPGDGDLVVFIPFIMQKAGTDIADGTKLVSYCRTKADNYFALELGLGTDGGKAYQLPSTNMYGAPSATSDADIRHVITYDIKGVNFYPAKYEVQYYNSYAEAKSAHDGDEVTPVHVDTTTLAGDILSDYSTVGELPSEDLFNVTEGQVITGFKYLAADGSAIADATVEVDDGSGNKTTTTVKQGVFKADLAMTLCESKLRETDNKCIVYVYPETEEGAEVRFYGTEADGTTEKIEKVYIKKGSTTFPKSKVPTFTITDKAIEGWYKTNSYNDADKVVFDAEGVTNATALSTLGSDDAGYNLYGKVVDMSVLKFYQNEAADETPLDTLMVKPNTAINNTAENGTLTVPTPTARTNYEFKGWNTAPNGSGTTYTSATILSTPFANSANLYAMWQAASDTPADNLTVTFDKNAAGASILPADGKVSKVKGDTLAAFEVPTVEWTDHDFKGWFETEEDIVNGDATAETFDPAVTINENKTYYAHWEYGEDQTDKATITFKSTDGSETYGTRLVQTGTPVGTLPIATKDNAVFDHWSTAENDGGTVFDENSTVSGDTIVYANFINNVTLTYYANKTPDELGETTEVAKQTDKSPIDAYAAPTGAEVTEDVTAADYNGDYNFLGWNTEANGSGDFIEPGEGVTYATVYLATAGSGKLYAQWGAVDPGEYPPTDPDDPPVPSVDDGVRVKFDPNTSDAIADYPQFRYPLLGDVLGALPTDPERTNYEFKGWNTKADGTGYEVDETTDITTDIGATLIDGETNKYELTVYAQWDVDKEKVPTEDRVTVTFYNNNDGQRGTAESDIATVTLPEGGTKQLQYTIKKDDKLGFIPEAITNTEHTHYSFKGDWYEDVTDETTAFAEDTVIGADKDYFAMWQVNLTAGVYDEAQTRADNMLVAVEYTYSGAVYTPKYLIYEIDEAGTIVGDAIQDESDLTGDTNFSVEYELIDVDNDNDVLDEDAELKDAGVYTPQLVVLDTCTLYPGFEIATPTDMTTTAITINAATLTPVVDTTKQTFKIGDTTPTATTFVTDVTGLLGTDTAADNYTIEYYKYTGTDDTAITNDDITEVAFADIDWTAEGKYIIKVVPSNDNYKMGAAAAADGTSIVDVYATGATSPAVADGQNIKLDVVFDKPWVINTDIKTFDTKNDDGTAKDPEAETQNTVYSDEYTTPFTGTIGSSTKPTDPDDGEPVGEYYVRVDKGTDEVEFTLTMNNESTTPDNIKVEVNGEEIEGAVTKDDSGKLIVKVPLTSTDPTNPDVITITTQTGSGDDAYPYQFTVQTLTDTSVDFVPGNSPYGLIERMGVKWGGDWTDGSVDASDNKVQDAKSFFDRRLTDDSGTTETKAANAFQAGDYLPAGAKTDVVYNDVAWNEDETTEATKPVENLDKNPNAVFVYHYLKPEEGEEPKSFVDPGIVARDAAGNVIENVKYTRTVKDVYMMSEASATAMASAVKEDITDTVNDDGEITATVFDKMKYALIRPGVYELEYTFTDPVTGTEQSFTRPLVYLWELGDSNLSEVFNGTDANYITQILKGVVSPLDGVEGVTRGLYYYRILDTNDSAVFNGTDANTITQILKGVVTRKTFYTEFVSN